MMLEHGFRLHDGCGWEFKGIEARTRYRESKEICALLIPGRERTADVEPRQKPAGPRPAVSWRRGHFCDKECSEASAHVVRTPKLT